MAWQGYPGDLSKKVIKDALKGAKHPKADFLAVRYESQVDARVAKAHDLAGDGALSGALKEIDAILADAKASDEQKKDATAIKDAVDAHVKALSGQAEQFVKSRDVERAVKVLEALSKEFGSAEAGEKAKKRLDEISADPKLKTELDAAKALQRLKDQIRELKRDKSTPKIAEFVKKNQGTRAAERASLLLRTIKTKS